MRDPAFGADRAGLSQALDALIAARGGTAAPAGGLADLPATLPSTGLAPSQVLDLLAPIVLAGARDLGAPTAFAHMDPPTPWLTWAMGLWTKAYNQNLLHPDVAPVARDLESRVIDWLAPLFGMDGGHLTAGSTLANLTALWAARDLAGVTTVAASADAHLSIAKSAHLLGLEFIAVPVDARAALAVDALPQDLTRTALVLTAGTTATGAIDDLGLIGRAAWSHIDAAWAGPLRLSARHGALLDGIERADSIAISPHKWLFQPKDCGMILFRDSAAAHAAVSFNGAYLAAPNVGLQGSRGASAVPLLASLLAWGRDGLVDRLDRTMAAAADLTDRLDGDPRCHLWRRPESAIVLWRPAAGDSAGLRARLPVESASLTTLGDTTYLRHVAANPNADVDQVWAAIDHALDADA